MRLSDHALAWRLLVADITPLLGRTILGVVPSTSLPLGIGGTPEVVPNGCQYTTHCAPAREAPIISKRRAKRPGRWGIVQSVGYPYGTLLYFTLWGSLLRDEPERAHLCPRVGGWRVVRGRLAFYLYSLF